MKKILLSFAVAVFTLTAAQAQTVWGIISNSEDHETLTAALEATGLDALLDSDEADVTVWAPNDDAFDALPPGVLDDLLADPDALTQILAYHVTPLTYFSGALADLDGEDLQTLLGLPVNISVDGGNIFVNEAQVIAPFNLDAETAGIVHTVSEVLLPPDVCTDFLFLSGDIPEAPVQENGICTTVSSPFVVWAGDIYEIEGFVAGIEYVFSICEGAGAGSWDPEISVISEDGQFIVVGVEDCEVTFTVPEDGTYLIGVSEAGACGDATENDQTGNGVPTLTCLGETVDNSVWDIIDGSPDHETLAAAIDAAGLVDALSAPGEFTVFAPTDDAFDVLGGAVADLLADPQGALTNVLLYHVVGGVALSTDLSDGMEIQTAQGETVTVTIDGGNVFINGAQVTVPDLTADNGVVHVLDAVLMPTVCTQILGEVFNFLNAGGAPAPDEDGVCEAIEFTEFGVWAGEQYPVDNIVEGTEYTFSICDGFGAGSWDATLIIRNLVTGAVIATEDGCEITWTAESSDDIGIIIQEQGICASTSDNTNVDNGSPSLTCTGEEVLGTVVDIIVNSPDHTVLADLVGQAGLVATLSGEGPFTVFAPTDAAFVDVDQATLDALAADPDGLLTEVLTYHVVSGAVFSGDLTDGMTAATVNGEELTFGVGATVTVGNDNGTATVTVPDLEASNGVVHVIDAVLIPVTLNVDHIASVGSLNIYPNPTNQQFTVDLNLMNAERVSIDLVNLVGQTVKAVDLGNRSTGLNREYIDVSGLPTGFYLMNITVGDSQVVTKVQVVR